MTLKERWAKLLPEQKRKTVVASVAIVVVLIGIIAYKVSHSGKHEAAVSKDTKGQTLSLDSGLLKKSEYEENQKQLTDLQKEFEQLKKAKNQQAQIANATGKEDAGVFNKKFPRSNMPLPNGFPMFKPSVKTGGTPFLSGGNGGYPLPPVKSVTKKPSVQIIGGIEEVPGSSSTDGGKDSVSTDNHKKKDTVYLPTSFMEATLLSGLDAPTSDSGKEGDVPVLLRIKAPAVLPNDVKANLKGCFVIAEGHGSLADERAHMRLVTLSCIAKNGRAVIDQKVNGFVVDQDGKVGLRGRVVSKMGSAITRSLIAGFFGGLGQATQSQTMSTSISALGTTQTIEPNKILEAGIGGGVAQAAEQLQKFYLDLAKQSMPVIEVGATRKVTLVISEGVNLEIKNFCNQMGDDQCKN